MRIRRLRQAMFAVLLTAAASAVAAEPASIDPFLGSYYGVGLVDDVEGAPRPVAIRESSVVIGPLAGGGFVLTWSALHAEVLSEPKAKETRLQFMPASKPGTYVASGDGGLANQRIWAKIDGTTLSVFIEGADADGARILQQWDRTLADKAMVLSYRRIREGETTRLVRLTLGKLVD